MALRGIVDETLVGGITVYRRGEGILGRPGTEILLTPEPVQKA